MNCHVPGLDLTLQIINIMDAITTASSTLETQVTLTCIAVLLPSLLYHAYGIIDMFICEQN